MLKKYKQSKTGTSKPQAGSVSAILNTEKKHLRLFETIAAFSERAQFLVETRPILIDITLVDKTGKGGYF